MLRMNKFIRCCIMSYEDLLWAIIHNFRFRLNIYIKMDQVLSSPDI